MARRSRPRAARACAGELSARKAAQCAATHRGRRRATLAGSVGANLHANVKVVGYCAMSPRRRGPPPAALAGDAAPRLLRIQEVAAETGLTPRSIRYYEEIGLLRPAARSQGDYRLYDASDLERLRFIREPARRRRLQPRRDRPAARGRGRAHPRSRAVPGHGRRRPRSGRSSRPHRPRWTARSRRSRRRPTASRAMIDAAEARRRHLGAHLAELEGGPPPPTDSPARRRRRGQARAVTDPRRSPARRAAGVPPSQLPALLRGPGDLARRLVDAVGRPGVARPDADERPAHARRRGGRPVPAGPGPRALRRRRRRRPARSARRSIAVEVGDGDPGGRPRRPHADRRRRGLDDPRPRAPPRLRRTPSTCRSARPSPWSWSGARTSATRSPSTRRCSTGPASSGPAVAGLTIAAFDVSTAFSSTALSFLAVIVGAAHDARDELRTPPPIARPAPPAPSSPPSARGSSTSRRTPVVLLAVVVVGSRPRSG